MKTYFTFLERNKLFTFVNVAGLSISLMFVLLIANMVTRQLTVDKDLPDADRIYVFANEHWAGGHYNLGDRLQSRYPEIEDWCAIKVSNPYVQPDDKPVQVLGASVKKNFFEFFRFPLLEGNREQLLTDDNSVVLTRSAALRLFGTEHAVGKTLKIIPCNNGIFTVTGIVEDINNSIIPSDIDIFIPFENMKYIQWSCSMECTEMNNAAGSTLFFRTAPGTDLNRKADDVVTFLREFYWLFRDSDSFKKVQFIPWHDFYFSETPATVYLNQYDFKLVVIFITVGVLILLMAVLNYISMSVAQTSYRAKEMATRRLLGSSRPDIFWRMITESALLTLVSFIIGFLLAKAAEPVAIDLLHAKLDIRDFPTQDESRLPASAQHRAVWTDYCPAHLFRLSLRADIPHRTRTVGLRIRQRADLSVLRLSKEPATLPHRSKEAALREACFFLMRHTLGRREQQYHLYSFGGQHLGDEFPDLYR